MVKYSRKLAEAKLERDLHKEALEFTRADLDRKIREDPDKYGLVKVTESALSSTILLNEKYQEKSSNFHDANFEVNLLQGVVNAVEQRKSALENLVRLHGQNYFSGPSVPHDLSELREKRKVEIEGRVGNSLKDITRTKKKK
jgi:hypothetical protein